MDDARSFADAMTLLGCWLAVAGGRPNGSRRTLLGPDGHAKQTIRPRA